MLWLGWAVALLRTDGLWEGAGWPTVAVILALFLVAEAVQLHVELRRQTFSLSLAEVPLVLGLFLLAPPLLLALRLLGTLVESARTRQSLSKAAFNAALASVEVGLVVLVGGAAAGMLSASRPADPRSWVAAYAALLAGTLLSGALVATAIRRLQGRLSRSDLGSMLVSLVLSACLNTTFALVLLVAVEAEPASAVLLLVLLAAVGAGYRAYGRLLRRHRSLAQLHGLTAAWSHAEGRWAVARELLVHGRLLLRAGHAELLLLDDDAPQHLQLDEGASAPYLVEPQAVPLGDALVQRVVESGSPVVLARSRRAAYGALQGLVLRDAAAVPVRHAGELMGVLLVGDRLGETSTFGPDDVELLEVVAAQAAVALHNGRLVDRLRHEAATDALTGLPNRSAFQARVAESLRAGDRWSVLLMDLDGFKDVNDTLGHHHGDELLKAVAARLRSSVPASVVVARLGGDEFALLAPLRAADADALSVARLLHAALLHPFLVDGVHLDVRASIGVSVYPEDGTEGATLLKRADIAMYEAKSAGNTVQAYDAAADHSSHRRLALVAELRGAVESGQLVCHYQPKLDLGTGQVTGVEALVRWPHPQLGLVGPDDFIPIAEQTGLVVPLTVHVLRESLHQIARWESWGRTLGVAVNVSARGLLASGFVRGVLDVLTETGVPPRRLTLEVTESSVMTDPARAVRVLTELADAGVQLSVDDFGTGYSSLAYLQRLPVHEVKIDKSFVGDLHALSDRAAIVRAIVDLGHTLGLQVVAEGVEDRATEQVLVALGCDLVQGYLYTRPLEPVALWCWLTEEAGREPHRRTPRRPGAVTVGRG